ncbi:MAG: hypothetical protein JWO67_5913 [Streptosporangiaceae bacterium]|jgi:hypothetical protein|nr:hypothetical protein [Streptosporangiaceae bacterium]
MVAITLTVMVTLCVGCYAVFLHFRPYLHGSNCEVNTPLGKEPLDLEQAANAATISAVAYRKDLPERAVVIAYATAMQESHLRNLPGGDRDSVGIFQQRPSQGWGAVDQLRDPVYASGRFFDALKKVKDYLDRDLYDAAQRVQRSADGTAYAQHEDEGKILAQAYTGHIPAAVRCWFSPDKRTAPRRSEAMRELRRSFGRLPSKGDAVLVGGQRSGWAVASWAVSHAQPYGLVEVTFAGRRWTADDGHSGWSADPKAPKDRVLIR